MTDHGMKNLLPIGPGSTASHRNPHAPRARAAGRRCWRSCRPHRQRRLRPPIGPAPPWRAGAWINSPPLRLDALKGKVVVLEFWTYG